MMDLVLVPSDEGAVARSVTEGETLFARRAVSSRWDEREVR